jgi:hypothetical protein
MIVCAPGAEPFARAALRMVADPVVADNPRQLMEGIGRKLGTGNRIQHLRIFDAFGPNPFHPMGNVELLTQLRGRFQPGARITVVVVSALRPGSVAGLGGFNGGFGGGGISAGFAGLATSSGAANDPAWVRTMAQVLGIVPAVQHQVAPTA